jgi:hypothetical protein
LNRIQKTLPLILALTIPLVNAYADAPAKTLSIQDQILQQMNSLLHAKPSISFDLSKKQIVEYSLIGAIALVIVIVIASSARSKAKRPKMT